MYKTCDIVNRSFFFECDIKNTRTYKSIDQTCCQVMPVIVEMHLYRYSDILLKIH